MPFSPFSAQFKWNHSSNKTIHPESRHNSSTRVGTAGWIRTLSTYSASHLLTHQRHVPVVFSFGWINTILGVNLMVILLSCSFISQTFIHPPICTNNIMRDSIMWLWIGKATTHPSTEYEKSLNFIKINLTLTGEKPIFIYWMQQEDWAKLRLDLTWAVELVIS